MEIKRLIISIAFCSSLLFTSCMPLKQFNELRTKADNYQKDNETLKEENRNLTVEVNELDGKVLSLQKKVYSLEQELEKFKKEKESLLTEKENLSKYRMELENQINKIKDGSSEEITKLLTELQVLQNDLQDRENRVKKSEVELTEKEQKLKETLAKYNEQQEKLLELQTALSKQKDAVSSLKEKLNQALVGFYDQGLSVNEKNGKIYVSLDEQLLFQTGSYSVDSKGQEALKSLSEVLAGNPDINVLIEGHTDDVPLTGSGQIKDNWDLSVMRATSVAKIILINKKINPQRITAAGRSEYSPLVAAKTPEARKKNRRTEIILTPNLTEVFKILQSN